MPPEHQALLFLAIAVVAWISASLPWLRIPTSVLEIVLGAVLGPHGFNFDQPGSALTLLADLGLGFLFLQAGFELDPKAFLGGGLRLGLTSWLLSIPLALLVAGLLIVLGEISHEALPWVSLAVITTSMGMVQPLLRDRELLPKAYRSLVMVHAGIGEVVPIILLSVLESRRSEMGFTLIHFVGYLLIALALMGVAAYYRGSLNHLLVRTMDGSAQLPMRFAIGLLVAMVALAHLLNIDVVLGALVAGVLLRFSTKAEIWHKLQARIDGVGAGFLVPIFFVVTGMSLDFAPVLSEPRRLIWIPCLMLFMLLVRGVPVVLMTRKHLPELSARLALGLDIATQLPLLLAVVVLAERQGVIEMSFATLLIAAAMATVLVFPALASWLLSRWSTPDQPNPQVTTLF
jgi:Kef-type K+ transport system membrane component KefB